ncbi:MAG: hypothetical protein U0797_26475 [Gemmataceae bacterium]
MTTNTTCDVYRAGSSPPASPDVAGVAIQLTANFGEFRMQTGEGVDPEFRYTHLALFPAGTDVRDGFDSGASGAATCDSVYVPDQNGTRFAVRFVERLGDGTRKGYLDRALPTWPTNEL